MADMTIAIACDHGGFGLKQTLAQDLQDQGYTVLDLGCSTGDSVDYPDYGYALAQAIAEGRADRGLVVCGSGIGISIAVNRFAAVRCALIHDALGARLCREHNDANVIAFGDRMIGVETARDALKIFLNTPFEVGRHQRRVEKLSNPPL